jgi:hypothetical protein
MKNSVFLDVVLCRYYVNRRFGGTSVYIISTRRHITEHGILQIVIIYNVEQLVRILCGIMLFLLIQKSVSCTICTSRSIQPTSVTLESGVTHVAFCFALAAQ